MAGTGMDGLVEPLTGQKLENKVSMMKSIALQLLLHRLDPGLACEKNVHFASKCSKTDDIVSYSLAWSLQWRVATQRGTMQRDHLAVKSSQMSSNGRVLFTGHFNSSFRIDDDYTEHFTRTIMD